MQLNVQSPSADCARVQNAASYLNGADFQFSQCFLNIAILPTRKKQISRRAKTTTTYSHCKVETSFKPCSDQWSFTRKLSRFIQVNNFPILCFLISITSPDIHITCTIRKYSSKRQVFLVNKIPLRCNHQRALNIYIQELLKIFMNLYEKYANNISKLHTRNNRFLQSRMGVD